MPLDLRPCELPSYQPTFDLTKQKFLPAKNIPTVRQLVKAKQDERVFPPRNEFVSRMEDSLIRWKPPGSSYRGTTMAIEGSHPYQLATSKSHDRSKGNGLGFNGGTYILDSVVNWWKGPNPTVCENIDKFSCCGEDRESNDEDDDFSLNYEPDRTGSIATGTTRTVCAAVPPRAPRAVTLVDCTPDNTVYEMYYGKPIPPDYLSGRYHDFSTLRQHRQQQQQQYQNEWDFSEWLKSCVSSCTIM
ncbi:hypothetical protein ZYGM_002256 [Zygosaccharomyces mellis]|uniref:Uncharacterized protein n=1 Tax=Zygosaccharomyces mellis TaxID=42258 RepID=A0A4C2E782_9SACH|nr:hypothetical protein ZYGM_002256 [Zygosaccharomyces mellis]